MASVSVQPASSDELVAEVIDNGQVSGQQLLVIGLCMLFNMLDGFDITAMAVVAGPVSADLGLSPDRLGWVFSFALAGMMAGAMFLAPVSDLIGRRKLVILSVALVGVSILLTARANSLTEFIVLRFVSGLGAGAMLACQATLAAEYSPDRFRALSVAAVTSGYPMGAMMTSVVAAYILPDYGWRGMFWFGGGLTLLMVVVAWLLIPESLKFLFERRPDDALARINRILSKLKKPTLAEMPEVIQTEAPPRRGLLGVMLALLAPQHRTRTLMLWSAFFLSFAALYFLMSWIPKMMEDAGFDAEVGRQAFFLFNLGGVIGIYVMGILTTRWMLSNVISLLVLGGAAGMVVIAFMPGELTLLLGMILAIGILMQGGFTGFYAAAAKAYPTEIRSTGIGWCIGLGRSGAVAGPAVAGYLIAAGFDMAANYLFFAVPLALSGIVAWRLQIR